MSATAALAITLISAMPGATGDQATGLGPAVEFTPTTAHAVQVFRRSGAPRPPRALAGTNGWICHGTRSVTCTTDRRTGRLRATVRYTATRARSSAVVNVWRVR